MINQKQLMSRLLQAIAEEEIRHAKTEDLICQAERARGRGDMVKADRILESLGYPGKGE